MTPPFELDASPFSADICIDGAPVRPGMLFWKIIMIKFPEEVVCRVDKCLYRTASCTENTRNFYSRIILRSEASVVRATALKSAAVTTCHLLLSRY